MHTMSTSTLTPRPLNEAFSFARGFLASEAARSLGVQAVTVRTSDLGLVEFRLDGDDVVGKEVAA
jgi:hypothetical protein